MILPTASVAEPGGLGASAPQHPGRSAAGARRSARGGAWPSTDAGSRMPLVEQRPRSSPARHGQGRVGEHTGCPADYHCVPGRGHGQTLAILVHALAISRRRATPVERTSVLCTANALLGTHNPARSAGALARPTSRVLALPAYCDAGKLRRASPERSRYGFGTPRVEAGGMATTHEGWTAQGGGCTPSGSRATGCARAVLAGLPVCAAAGIQAVDRVSGPMTRRPPGSPVPGAGTTVGRSAASRPAMAAPHDSRAGEHSWTACRSQARAGLPARGGR